VKKELYLLALIAAFVVLVNYFPAQSLKADDPIISTTPSSGDAMYGFDSRGRPLWGKVEPRAIPNPGPAIDLSNLTTEWVGPVIIEAEDSTPKNQHFQGMNFEIGLRSDGVVVWRKKEKP